MTEVALRHLNSAETLADPSWVKEYKASPSWPTDVTPLVPASSTTAAPLYELLPCYPSLTDVTFVIYKTMDVCSQSVYWKEKDKASELGLNGPHRVVDCRLGSSDSRVALLINVDIAERANTPSQICTGSTCVEDGNFTTLKKYSVPTGKCPKCMDEEEEFLDGAFDILGKQLLKIEDRIREAKATRIANEEAEKKKKEEEAMENIKESATSTAFMASIKGAIDQKDREAEEKKKKEKEEEEEELPATQLVFEEEPEPSPPTRVIRNSLYNDRFKANMIGHVGSLPSSEKKAAIEEKLVEKEAQIPPDVNPPPFTPSQKGICPGCKQAYNTYDVPDADGLCTFCQDMKDFPSSQGSKTPSKPKGEEPKENEKSSLKVCCNCALILKPGMPYLKTKEDHNCCKECFDDFFPKSLCKECKRVDTSNQCLTGDYGTLCPDCHKMHIGEDDWILEKEILEKKKKMAESTRFTCGFCSKLADLDKQYYREDKECCRRCWKRGEKEKKKEKKRTEKRKAEIIEELSSDMPSDSFVEPPPTKRKSVLAKKKEVSSNFDEDTKKIFDQVHLLQGLKSSTEQDLYSMGAMAARMFRAPFELHPAIEKAFCEKMEHLCNEYLEYLEASNEEAEEDEDAKDIVVSNSLAKARILGILSNVKVAPSTSGTVAKKKLRRFPDEYKKFPRDS